MSAARLLEIKRLCDRAQEVLGEDPTIKAMIDVIAEVERLRGTIGEALELGDDDERCNAAAPAPPDDRAPELRCSREKGHFGAHGTHEPVHWSSAPPLGPVPERFRKQPAELRDQRFQLTGDARLQFWREAYLAALPTLIDAKRDHEWTPSMAAAITAAARDIADMAMAQHLLVNDVEAPDALVDLWTKTRGGSR